MLLRGKLLRGISYRKLPAGTKSVALAYKIRESTDNATHQEATVRCPFSKLRGKYKGKIRMADDFDAPLEELAEYYE